MLFGGESGKGEIEGNAVAAAGFFQVPLAFLEAFRLPGFDDPAGDGERAVGQGELVVDFDDPAKAAAEGAGADRMVEGKKRRGGIVEIALVAGAVVTAGIEVMIPRLVDQGHRGGALTEAKAGGEGLGEARAVLRGKRDAVLNHRKEVLFPRCLAEGVGKLLQPALFVQAGRLAVEEGAAKSLPGDKGGCLVRRGFCGKGNPEKKPGLLAGELFPKILKDGVGGPGTDGVAAIRAGEVGQPGEEQFQMIGDFRDRADRAAGGADRIGLAEGDGGRNAVDAVDAGAIHALEELPGVGAESFRVAALSLGVEGVEGEGGFSRTGRSGEDVEHSQGQVEGEVLQVILAGSFDTDGS